jgi:hypothetical protein
MAFVRGERVGLARLKRVLPNIFETFQGCDPRAVLVECGLSPRVNPWSPHAVTFYFAPEQDGRAMYNPDMSTVKKRACLAQTLDEPDAPVARLAKTSDELMQDYSFVSSSWTPRS